MDELQLSRTDNCINEHIRRYGDMVLRIGLLYLRNREDAEDVFQETFIKLFNSGKQFADEGHLKAWLITVASNQCKNILRSPWRRRSAALTELTAAVEDEYGIDESDLVKELLKLPIKYRRVLYLYYYEGYRSEEIAELIRVSPATVRTQMRRGRELLKGRLLDTEGVV